MDILTLQKTLNTMLVPAGYTKLTEDGVLGKKTCGAAREYMPTSVPAECSSKGYEAPTKASAAKTVTSVSTTTVPAAVTTSSMSLISSTKWIIGSSIAVGLGLVAFAFAKKKKWL
jgi:hypothetical protein